MASSRSPGRSVRTCSATVDVGTGSPRGSLSASTIGSRSGRYGVDPPNETQRPSSQVTAEPETRPRSSSSNRLLPMPGSPELTRSPPSPARARSAIGDARSNSRSRPTIGHRRDRRPVPSRSPIASNAETGSAFPLSSRRRSSLHVNRSPAARRVTAPTRTDPAAHATAGEPRCSARRRSRRTRPALPRRSVRAPPARSRRRPGSRSESSSACSMIRSPARIARSASSSCVTGAPNSARIPSPARSLTVPPKASTASTMRRTAPPRTSRASSGSMRSVSWVEPTTSANRAVTTLRSSRISPAIARFWPSSGPMGTGGVCGARGAYESESSFRIAVGSSGSTRRKPGTPPNPESAVTMVSTPDDRQVPRGADRPDRGRAWEPRVQVGTLRR